MSEERDRTVLVVDDDEAIRTTLRKVLSRDFTVETAPDGEEALLRLDSGEVRPDVILLDIRMPGPDGYEVCRRIQEREELAWVPVIFVTVLESERDRKRALEAGGAGYVTKPFDADEILDCIRENVGTRDRWSELRSGGTATRDPSARDVDPRTPSSDHPAFDPTLFDDFKRHLARLRELDDEQVEALEAVHLPALYALGEPLDMTDEQVVEELADYLDLPFTERIDVPEQALGALPRAFCRRHRVVPLEDGSLVISNPFDLELMDTLERGYWRGEEPRVVLSAPGRVRGVFSEDAEEGDSAAFEEKTLVFDRDLGRRAETPGTRRANEILRSAVAEGASDVHLQTREGRTEVRFRIEGEMETIQSLSPGETAEVISRLKALAGMDLAERRRPQDGSVPAHLGERRFKLRLATTSTTHGESMVIRILEPDADPIPLVELGMTEDQAEALKEMASRNQGTLLMVGPTGSGKSTTIFTVLSHVDTSRRSVMSVEDPVEYSVPDAHQQEVNEAADLTFDTLLKSAVRQDPDVLFLGEIRDDYSARALMDFASSGHLTLSSMHAANATAAIFRLERLGVERGSMAEALSMVVSQKLLRTLCPDCREVSAPTAPEREMLTGFVDDMPDEVARPVGCSECRNTGYRGREAVFEVLDLDHEIRRMVREGLPADRIRNVFRERGSLLIDQHALAKVRDLRFAVDDVYQTVLLEEQDADAGFDGPGSRGAAAAGPKGETRRSGPERTEGRDDGAGRRRGRGSRRDTILVVAAEAKTRRKLAGPIEEAGYDVTRVKDGVEAIWELSKQRVGAVVSEVDMSTMEGPVFLLLLDRRGMEVPVFFVTPERDDRLEAGLIAQGAEGVVSLDTDPDVLLARLGRTVGTPGR